MSVKILFSRVLMVVSLAQIAFSQGVIIHPGTEPHPMYIKKIHGACGYNGSDRNYHHHPGIHLLPLY